jgi:hypothetical protein
MYSDLRMNRRAGRTGLPLAVLLSGLAIIAAFVALTSDSARARRDDNPVSPDSVEAAALGAAQVLAASVVLSSGQAVYLVPNQSVTTQVSALLTQTTSLISLEYGTFAGPGVYVYAPAATYYSNTWHYEPEYPAGSFVPVSVDAVKVVVDGSTAAAALQGIPNYTPPGQPWPMTRCESPVPDPVAGPCNPVPFWSSNGTPDCPAPANFTSLVQFGAHQGSSNEGAHLQLLSAHDERAPLPDATYGQMVQHCGSIDWYPGGNCSNLDPEGHGDVCCVDAGVARLDVANYILHDFMGRISLTATEWLDEYGIYHDWRSEAARNREEQGDWLEVYNSGNFGQNIQASVYDHIRSPNHRQVDSLYPYYGYHVNRVMYLYDPRDSEVWDTRCSTCPYEWLSVRPNEAPERVHMTQSVVFRFYERLVMQGIVPRPAFCAGTGNINISGSEVLGFYAGATVPGPPPTPGPHGLYNYVSLVPVPAPASLVGHVVWQGRPAQPSPLQQLPVTLTLKLGATEVNYPALTTDASGYFTVPVGGLGTGTYAWRAKGPTFLANSGVVNLSPQFGVRDARPAVTNSAIGGPVGDRAQPHTPVEMGMMRAGDASNDNAVSAADFSILRSTFGLSQGQTGYDDRADFTGDAVVNITDFSLLRLNFGVGGAPPLLP